MLLQLLQDAHVAVTEAYRQGEGAIYQAKFVATEYILKHHSEIILPPASEIPAGVNIPP
jgi:hypothetical protein